MKWGPTKIPVYNVLLSFNLMNSPAREKYMAIAQWLINTAKVPVDGTDLSGTTALMHSISINPYLDKEFAQLMLDASGDMNHRNRFGCTIAHDAVKVNPLDPTAKQKSFDAIRWFLAHGGDPDIKDVDGLSVRYMVGRLATAVPGYDDILSQASHEAGTTTDDNQESSKKNGRNKLCPCGSSRKYKKCCGKD